MFLGIKKNLILVLVLVLIAGSIWYIEKNKVYTVVTGVSAPQDISFGSPNPPSSVLLSLSALAKSDKAAGFSPAVEIVSPTGFINAPENFKIAQLIGKKIILVDFWTYSCINCIRTLPYLTAWYAKYRDQGLEIVGIHTPEFDFEKDINNVRTAVEKYGIKYPVILDSNYGTWNAYNNRYWPHEYLIDLAGFVVHDQIGEGNYDETDMEIRKLLMQKKELDGTSKTALPSSPIVAPPAMAPGGPLSPETYFGSARNEYLANGTPGKTGEQHFTEPQTAEPNSLYLAGDWNITPEYAESNPPASGSSSRIDYHYNALGVYFVAGILGKDPVEVEVLRDSKPIPQSAAGSDIFYQNGKSYVRVNETRLYRIIDDKQSGSHFLEFIISKPGLRAYTFTFG